MQIMLSVSSNILSFESFVNTSFQFTDLTGTVIVQYTTDIDVAGHRWWRGNPEISIISLPEFVVLFNRFSHFPHAGQAFGELHVVPGAE